MAANVQRAADEEKVLGVHCKVRLRSGPGRGPGRGPGEVQAEVQGRSRSRQVQVQGGRKVQRRCSGE